MKITTVIIDDDRFNITYLQKLIDTYCPDLEVVATATNVADGIKVMQKEKPGILLLDIQLRNKTCFDLLACIDTAELCTILISAYDNYGPKAFKYNILEYILKPVSIEELVEATNKAKDIILKRNQPAIAAPSNVLSFTENNFLKFKNVSDITHLEALDNYTRIYALSGETFTTSKTLKEYESTLPVSFIRVSRSFIVNIAFVEAIAKAKNLLIMKDNTKIALTQNIHKLISGLTNH